LQRLSNLARTARSLATRARETAQHAGEVIGPAIKEAVSEAKSVAQETQHDIEQDIREAMLNATSLKSKLDLKRCERTHSHMLRTPLLHPQIAEALARAGHSSKVLLADSNYPAATKLGPNARLVHLNLAPGLVSATDILRVLVQTIPIEAAEVMVPQDGSEPEIFAEFREILKSAKTFDRDHIDLTTHDRFTFYDVAEAPMSLSRFKPASRKSTPTCCSPSALSHNDTHKEKSAPCSWRALSLCLLRCSTIRK
jgi:L-fucose mutarotase